MIASKNKIVGRTDGLFHRFHCKRQQHLLFPAHFSLCLSVSLSPTQDTFFTTPSSNDTFVSRNRSAREKKRRVISSRKRGIHSICTRRGTVYRRFLIINMDIRNVSNSIDKREKNRRLEIETEGSP